jgi:uncharacterized RDD family membrane protein YckC
MSTPASAFSRGCPNHPDVSTDLRPCSRCKKLFCPDCLVEFGGKLACATCKDEILRDVRSGTVEEVEVAGPFRRLGGSFIDGLVMTPLLIVWMVWVFVRAMASGSATPPTGFNASNYVVGVLLGGVFLVYDALMTASGGQTLGKKALNMKVVTRDGADVTPGMAWGRAVSRFVMNSAYVGIIDALFVFTSERRTLHDRIAGTIVVKAHK